jgi:hypothetical protein
MACLGVPFIAGAKLLDSVRPAAIGHAMERKPLSRPTPRHRLSRNQPRDRRSAHGSTLPSSHRID